MRAWLRKPCVDFLLALTILPAMLYAAVPPRGPQEHELEEHRRLMELSHEISAINLLNGIRLTRQQTEQVLALAREAQKLRASSPHTEYYRKALGEAVRAYEAFKAEAIKGEPPAGRVSHNAVHHEHRVNGIRNRRARLLDQRITEFDARLKQVLTEGQVQIVESFKPCLVPPKDLRDPVRAGQAAGDRPIQMLSRLRSLPASVWNGHKGEIAEQHVRRLEGMHLEITKPEARAAAKQRFIELVDKARAMSDVEFGMEKGTLAGQLSPNESRRALFESSRVVRGKARPQAHSACVRWLLHRSAVAILEERLKAGTAFKAAPGAAAVCAESTK